MRSWPAARRSGPRAVECGGGAGGAGGQPRVPDRCGTRRLAGRGAGGCLRAFGRVESAHVAARSKALSAFNAQGGFEADGQATLRTWLRWQTQVTNAGAGAATGWMRRLAVHPRVLAALGAAEVTTSFARLICDASDLLVPELRDEADEILLAAAAGGATEADLVMLAQEMRERSAPPDTDGPEAAGMMRMGSGTGGSAAGRALPRRGEAGWGPDPGVHGGGDCAAGFAGEAGRPEDTRTQVQRDHDALEEAARRLIAGGLPDTAGQPTQVQLHVTLDQLRDLPGAAEAERAWAAARAAADGTPGLVYSRAGAEAYACDAQLIPVVTGHLDPVALDAVTGRYLAGFRRPDPARPGLAPAAATAVAPDPPPPAAHPAGLRRRHPLRARRARRVPAHRAPGQRLPRHRQPAAGHRHPDRDRPAPPAAPGHPARPALRLPRLPPKARPLPGPSPDPPGQGRRDRIAQPGLAVLVPPPDRGPSLGLDPGPQSPTALPPPPAQTASEFSTATGRLRKPRPDGLAARWLWWPGVSGTSIDPAGSRPPGWLHAGL